MKNKKNPTSYITLEESNDFREIARLMSEDGDQINHATARNILLSGISDLLKGTGNRLGKKMTNKQIEAALNDNETYYSLQEVLFGVKQLLEKEGYKLPTANR